MTIDLVDSLFGQIPSAARARRICESKRNTCVMQLSSPHLVLQNCYVIERTCIFSNIYCM